MKKYASVFVIIALFLVAILTYQLSKESYRILPIEEEPQDVSLEVYNFQNWHEFTSPNGTFKVMFPTLPQHATENITVPETGKKRHYDMYVSELPNRTIFMITLITFQDPEEMKEPDRLMREMMNSMVASNPDNVLREIESSNYNGYDSRDFSYGNNETNIDAKIFMVDETLFVLTRLVKTENYNANEFNFFVNSFELQNNTKPTRQ